MKIFTIPNGITCLNLLCGCAATCCAFRAAYAGDVASTVATSVDFACFFIIAGAVFDFFDGMTARLLHSSSPIGKELDSLADIVTFGIAPAALCFFLMGSNGFAGISHPAATRLLPLTAFLMAAFSALRLAKFNIDERQTTSFIGMPTPANALFWIGLAYADRIPAIAGYINGWALLIIMAACSVLLVCEIPMFSFKVKFDHLGWRANALPYGFAVACLILFALFGRAGFALAILLYVLLSICVYRKTAA